MRPLKKWGLLDDGNTTVMLMRHKAKHELLNSIPGMQSIRNRSGTEWSLSNTDLNPYDARITDHVVTRIKTCKNLYYVFRVYFLLLEFYLLSVAF